MHLQAVGKKHTQVEQMSEHLKQSVEAVHFGIMGEVDADAGAQMIKPANFDRQTIRLWASISCDRYATTQVQVAAALRQLKTGNFAGQANWTLPWEDMEWHEQA